MCLGNVFYYFFLQMMNLNLVVLTCMIHNSRPYHGFYKLFINSSPQPDRALKDKIFFAKFR